MYSHIIYRRKLFQHIIIYIIVFLLLGLASTYILKSKTLSIIFLILLVAPLFFLKLLLRKYTKKIAFQFYNDCFIIVLDNLENTILLNQIESYSLQLPNEKFNSIKFNLKNNQSLDFSFLKKNKTRKTQIVMN
jgi:hypothetical protein